MILIVIVTFRASDFVTTARRMLENFGLHVTIKAALAIRNMCLDITGTGGQEFLRICWRYR